MGENFIQYIINIIILIPIIVLLATISIKLGRADLFKPNNRYVQVLEKNILDKDSNIYVLKIGDEGCVVISSSSSNMKIRDLTSGEIKNIESRDNEKRQKIKTYEFRDIIDKFYKGKKANGNFK